MELKVRRRVRLKNKETKALFDELSAILGMAPWDESLAVETADFGDQGIIIVGGKILGLSGENGPFLSVRGLLQAKPQVRYVTVDMGAIRFVTNGADTMAPGIVDADPNLKPGEWCFIRDERNKQPLAVGIAVMDGITMKESKSGKAVKAVTFVGDKLWAVDEASVLG